MQEIGSVLRQAREEKGLTLEEISSRTMISKKHLRALEEGEFKLFPGEVYLKGALRKYAEELGLNPEELVLRYGGPRPAVKAEKNERETAEPQNRLTVKRVVPPAQLMRSSRRLNKRRLVMVLLIFALLVVGIRAISTVTTPESPVVTVPPPVVENGTEDILPPEEQIPELEPEPEPPQVRVERDSQDPLKLTVFNAATIEVVLSFTEHSWVRVHTDGVQLFEGTFATGQNRSLTARESVRVRTGNALGTMVVVNGEAILLPQARNPVTLEISAAGFE